MDDYRIKRTCAPCFRNLNLPPWKFKSQAAARAYRLGSKPDFLLAANCHPVVKWAEEEPEVNPEELAKVHYS